MSRFVVFATLVLCLCYAYQAYAMPQDKSEEHLSDKVKDAWNSMSESVAQSFNDMAKNPKVQEALENTKDFIGKAMDTINEEAGKLKDKLS